MRIRMQKICLMIYGSIFILTAVAVLEAKESMETPSKSVVFVGGARQSGSTPFPNDERTKKIIKQTGIEREALALEKRGLYEEAIAKYEEALDSALLNREVEKATALWGIMRIHQRQGKYELALEELQWFLKANPKKRNYWDKKVALEAFIEAKKIGSYEPIYTAIKVISENNRDVLPPKTYQSYTTGVVGQLIQLYDYAGGWDGGIALVDDILAYKKLTSSARENYLKVRQAFIDDKANSTKGRATQTLIQSDYFPW